MASISEEPGWDHSSLTPQQSVCVKYDISARGMQKTTTQAATAAFFLPCIIYSLHKGIIGIFCCHHKTLQKIQPYLVLSISVKQQL